MTQATGSTTAIYGLLVARILNYVPTGTALPATPLSTVIGNRAWVVRQPDNPQGWPFIVLRLVDRQSDGWDHGLLQTFALEVQCFNRPYNLAGITKLQAVADQVEAALTDYKEPTAPLTIRRLRLRQTPPPMTDPADRDVCREFLEFEGFLFPYYLTTEVGSS